MAFEIIKPIKNLSGGALDANRGPYNTVEAACLAIPNVVVDDVNFREGKQVDIGTDGHHRTYWWQGGYDDEHLVEMLIKGDRGYKAWEKVFEQEEYGTGSDYRVVQKLADYVDGEGDKPTDNIGLYLKADGTYTADRDLAQSIAGKQGQQGEQGIPGITTTNMAANSLLGNDTGATGTPKSLSPNGLILYNNKVHTAAGILTGTATQRVVNIVNPTGGYYKSDTTPVGAMKIKFPSNAAVHFVMKGTVYKSYSSGSDFRTIAFTISGYTSSMGNNATAIILSDFGSYTVRWYTDGTTPYVTIGELDNTWANVAVVIDNIQLSYSGLTQSYFDAFALDISFISAFTGTLLATRTQTRPLSNLSQPLTGLLAGSNTPIADTDPLLVALAKLQAQDSAKVPYTGATADVNLNTKALTLGGNFTKDTASFEKSILRSGTTSSHFRKLTDVASYSNGSDSTTPGDIIITLPITSATKWIADVSIGTSGVNLVRLRISAYSTSNSNPIVDFVSGPTEYIASVKIGRLDSGKACIIIKRSSGTSTFLYGVVNIDEFMHYASFSSGLDTKSNFLIEFFDEAALVGYTNTVTIPFSEFRLSLDKRTFLPLSAYNATSGVLIRTRIPEPSGAAVYRATLAILSHTSTNSTSPTQYVFQLRIEAAGFTVYNGIQTGSETTPTFYAFCESGVVCFWFAQAAASSSYIASVLSPQGVTGSAQAGNLVTSITNEAKPAVVTKEVTMSLIKTLLASEKGANNGVATLDAAGKVPTAQLPASPVTSVAGKTGVVTLSKGDVGLGNVDNTSDADKPISTATAAALAEKVGKLTATAAFTNGDVYALFKDVTVTGAAIGDPVLVSLPMFSNFGTLYKVNAQVQSSNTVRVMLSADMFDAGSSDATFQNYYPPGTTDYDGTGTLDIKITVIK
ncbi:hypothetical protein D9M68_367410 [compost metagenome]